MNTYLTISVMHVPVRAHSREVSSQIDIQECPNMTKVSNGHKIAAKYNRWSTKSDKKDSTRPLQQHYIKCGHPQRVLATRKPCAALNNSRNTDRKVVGKCLLVWKSEEATNISNEQQPVTCADTHMCQMPNRQTM